MAIYVRTREPEALLVRVRQLVAGETNTWQEDGDGDFEHVTANRQYIGRAWIHPEVQVGRLAFYVVGTGSPMVWSLYALMQGRFVGTLVSHALDGEDVLVTTAREGLDTETDRG